MPHAKSILLSPQLQTHKDAKLVISNELYHDKEQRCKGGGGGGRSSITYSTQHVRHYNYNTTTVTDREVYL